VPPQQRHAPNAPPPTTPAAAASAAEHTDTSLATIPESVFKEEEEEDSTPRTTVTAIPGVGGGLQGGGASEGGGDVFAGVKLYYAGVGADGKKKTDGPLQFGEFKRLCLAGVVTLNTRVWRKPPGGDWRKLQKDEELLQCIATSDDEMMNLVALSQKQQ